MLNLQQIKEFKSFSNTLKNMEIELAKLEKKPIKTKSDKDRIDELKIKIAATTILITDSQAYKHQKN